MSMKRRALEEVKGVGGEGLLEKCFWDRHFLEGMLIVPGAGLCPLAGRGEEESAILLFTCLCKREKMKNGKEREGREGRGGEGGGKVS